jgi:hypothetical protein
MHEEVPPKLSDVPPTKDCKRVELPVCNPLPDAGIAVTPNAAMGWVHPPNVCVKMGTMVKFTVHPTPKPTVTYASVPKDPNDTWMNSSNTPEDPGVFSFQVPDKLDPGEYDYLVVSGDGFCVDPRITVPPG